MPASPDQSNKFNSHCCRVTPHSAYLGDLKGPDDEVGVLGRVHDAHTDISVLHGALVWPVLLALFL